MSKDMALSEIFGAISDKRKQARDVIKTEIKLGGTESAMDWLSAKIKTINYDIISMGTETVRFKLACEEVAYLELIAQALQETSNE